MTREDHSSLAGPSPACKECGWVGVALEDGYCCFCFCEPRPPANYPLGGYYTFQLVAELNRRGITVNGLGEKQEMPDANKLALIVSAEEVLPGRPELGVEEMWAWLEG